MVAGETLLKLSDFPFAYSLVAIIFIAFGFNDVQIQTQNGSDFPFLFLSIASFVAGLFTAMGPGDKMIRHGRIYAIKNSKKDEQTKTYELSALETRAINLEIEKVVSLFYLIFIVLAFFMAVLFSPNFVNHLVIDHNEITNCDVKCVNLLGTIIPISIFAILIIEGSKKILALSKRIEIVAFYRYCMDQTTATSQSKENLNRAIEQNDWGLASWWKTQLDKEIEVEEGLEERRMKIELENLEKKIVAYNELMIILTMAKLIGSDHHLCQESKKTHIFSLPDDENRFREIFAKYGYLLEKQLLQDYFNYEKDKMIKSGTLPATNLSHQYSISDLTNMEQTAKNEFEKIKQAYRTITGIEEIV